MGSSLSSGKINTPSGDAPSRPDVDGVERPAGRRRRNLGVGERNVEGKETNLRRARVGTRAEEREERGRLPFASELASDARAPDAAASTLSDTVTAQPPSVSSA